MPDHAIASLDDGPPRAPLRFALAALGAGIFGALVIPGYELGLNVLLTWIAVTAAAIVGRPRSMSAESLVWCAASFVFASTALLLDADWIVAANLITATWLGLLAVTGVTTWKRMIAEATLFAFRLFDGVAYALQPLFERVPSPRRSLGSAARGGIIGVGLIVVFGTLFFTADRAFADLTRKATNDVWMDWIAGSFTTRVFVGLVLVAGVGALVLTGPLVDVHGWTPRLAHIRIFGPSPLDERMSRRLDRLEWATPLIALDVLFASFVGVQITVLFGGERHVLETAGLTYAQYARTGFLQLCAVGAGTLIVVIGTVHWARRKSRRDDLLLRVLLGLLLALTLVVLASALRRLNLYEAAYGYTRVRLAVHVAIFWLAGIIVLVGVAGLRLRGNWLPRATIGLTTAGLLAFTAFNPDALIARLNVDRYLNTGRVDVAYLAGLSADAAHELGRLPEPLRNCALEGLGRRLGGGDSWLSFNAARSRARAVVGSTEVDPFACSK